MAGDAFVAAPFSLGGRRKSGISVATFHLFQRLDADFLEKDDVVVAVILEADVALVGASAPLRFEIEFALGNRLALGVVGGFYIVQEDHGVRAVQCDDHGVPLGTGLARLGEGLGERIQRAGNVIFVFI